MILRWQNEQNRFGKGWVVSTVDFSCKGCGNRYPGCHGNCETYKAERAEYDKLKAKHDFEKKINGGLYQQRSRSVKKANKKGYKGT